MTDDSKTSGQEEQPKTFTFFLVLERKRSNKVRQCQRLARNSRKRVQKRQLKKKCSGRVNARKGQKTGNRRKNVFLRQTEREKEQLLRSKITKLNDKLTTLQRDLWKRK